MANLNRVLLIGNLTRDPEIKYTPKGTAIAEIGLAINRVLPADEGGERREEVTFVEVTAWGKTAENVQKYLTKGRPVFVEGRLQLDTWDDKQTGQKRSKLKVVAETVQFLGSKAESAGSEPSQGSQRRPTPAARPQPQRDPDLDEEPDEIPFRSTIYRDVRRSKLNRRVF
jgi:single-strand DNA-binding protein